MIETEHNKTAKIYFYVISLKEPKYMHISSYFVDGLHKHGKPPPNNVTNIPGC